jgi:putative FmdB family regulatory protein
LAVNIKKTIQESEMPIYEYECECCGQCFEQLVFAGDEKKVNCPECGKAEVRKLISCTSFFSDSTLGTCASGSKLGFS